MCLSVDDSEVQQPCLQRHEPWTFREPGGPGGRTEGTLSGSGTKTVSRHDVRQRVYEGIEQCEVHSTWN